MTDKVKPLKLETTIDGSSNDLIPVETKPDQDYLAAKGLCFENNASYLAEKVGSLLYLTTPDQSQKPTYLANGEVDAIEFFNGATQITANRIARVDMTYDGSLNPITETWKIYDSNGTTVLRTFTITHTFVSADLTNSVLVTT